MTVQELIEQLNRVEDKDRQVQVWLPGRRIVLEALLRFTAVDSSDPVLIEGNLLKLGK